MSLYTTSFNPAKPLETPKTHDQSSLPQNKVSILIIQPRPTVEKIRDVFRALEYSLTGNAYKNELLALFQHLQGLEGYDPAALTSAMTLFNDDYFIEPFTTHLVERMYSWEAFPDTQSVKLRKNQEAMIEVLKKEHPFSTQSVGIIYCMLASLDRTGVTSRSPNYFQDKILEFKKILSESPDLLSPLSIKNKTLSINLLTDFLKKLDLKNKPYKFIQTLEHSNPNNLELLRKTFINFCLQTNCSFTPQDLQSLNLYNNDLDKLQRVFILLRGVRCLTPSIVVHRTLKNLLDFISSEKPWCAYKKSICFVGTTKVTFEPPIGLNCPTIQIGEHSSPMQFSQTFQGGYCLNLAGKDFEGNKRCWNKNFRI